MRPEPETAGDFKGVEMKKVLNAEKFPSNIEVSYEDGEETNIHTINLDGTSGEFTAEEWREDLMELGFDTDGVERIIELLGAYEWLSEE